MPLLRSEIDAWIVPIIVRDADDLGDD